MIENLLVATYQNESGTDSNVAAHGGEVDVLGTTFQFTFPLVLPEGARQLAEWRNIYLLLISRDLP